MFTLGGPPGGKPRFIDEKVFNGNDEILDGKVIARQIKSSIFSQPAFPYLFTLTHGFRAWGALRVGKFNTGALR
jgi:hypothetical protein